MATQQLNRLAGLLTSAYSASRLADESDGDLLDRCRAGADPAAFEAIVRRHGGRVLGACRKVLIDPSDIDDAFQATFLTLLRNPNAVRKATSLGAWLYGVAHRIAVRARDTAHRRRGLLKKAARPAEAEEPDLSWKEACAALHAELDRLPDSLRLPLVLCYLEGLSRDEAAHQLGWSLNEVRGRLERGRDRLRKRLEKRGIALSAGLLATAAGNSVTADVPPTRFIEIALRVPAGRSTAAAVALAHGVSPTMMTTFKVLAVALLAAGVLNGVGTNRPDAQAGPKSAAAKPADPATTDAKPSAPPEFAGKVFGPDGKPVKGAKVYFLYYTPKALPVPERATTDADGSFRFTIKADELDPTYRKDPWNAGVILAHAPGFGRGWTPAGGKTDQLAVRLTKDDKPLAGRLVNLEGKPVAGVTVRVTELLAPYEGKDLSGFIDDLKKRQAGYPVLRDRVTGFEGFWIGRDLGALIPPVQTDENGRFAIPGIGADRIATIRFDSPLVEGRTLRVLTREAETVTVGEWEPARMAMAGNERATMTFMGNDFTHALAPGRTVTGVVKDKATGKPIPGARIESQKVAGHPIWGRNEFSTEADKDGRFTLHGLPLGAGNFLRASPPAGQPYLMRLREVPVPTGTNPAPLDFELTRGVELTVHVTDAATKAPVPGWIEYFTFRDNPEMKDIKGFTTPGRGVLESADGVIRLVVPAGPGLVAFRARTDRYPVAVGAEQFKDRMNGALITTIPSICHVDNFTALAPVEPKPGAQSAEVRIALDGGKTVKGRVLGPDGKPLAGVLARGLQSAPLVFGVWEQTPLKGAEFEAVGVDAKRPRALVFIHTEKKLAGSVRVTGAEKGPIEVTLRPWATLTGRLVDADGRPQADVKLSFTKSLEDPDPAGVGDLPNYEIRTDAQGRFTVTGFAPGLRYNLAAIQANRVVARVADGTQFKEGEEKDVGDVAVKPME
jgi:RNA polymerase sigma factor (sigma-70 family)